MVAAVELTLNHDFQLLVETRGGMDQQILQGKRQYDLASIDRCNSIQSQADLLDDLREQAVQRAWDPVPNLLDG
jgi:hypothetical protein